MFASVGRHLALLNAVVVAVVIALAGLTTFVLLRQSLDREADSALVVGAGVPARWTTEAPGVVVRGLRTVYGALDLTMRADGNSVVRVHIGAMERVPRGGVVVRPPLARPVRSVTVNGAAAAATRDAASGEAEVVVRRLPADVAFRY